ncbi:hypothetical protein PAECIP112173_02764 [Paenibacillus sp. JJ-100]|uniref:WXG100 family type VII secretion target n=1 Tax=Paenibacillus sp. JJ-100 TaxID=2974896 RepID=UPI0022FF6747|nr:WXG100 family type VII secretion target [Paenibacillus sp. JJ-100]CAI6080004.1 hypothetical protein PAECIP112173_02764 [Paenibacillus sp. JJ-100]
MSTIKVTPEQLHHVSKQVDQARQQLEVIQQDLTRHIMFLQTMWLGVTQENFYRQFTLARPVLQKALESMTYTSQDLNDIATRFENADAETGSIGGVLGVAVGAATMMKSSGTDGGSEDKGYRMAQVNIYGRYVWLPVNENGVTDQAALQAYKKDHGHVDFNRMQAEAVKPEEPEEDIYALQIKAFENRTHPFTGEPVSDRYAKMMITSLKYSQLLMAFQMVRGSIPGRKGPFHFSASDPAVAKIKENLKKVNSKSERTNSNVGEEGPKPKSEITNTGQYSGGLVKVPKADIAADNLADRLGGESRVKFKNDPKGREFDTVSDEYIAQTKPPLNSLDKQFRKQAKATIEAAIETGKKAYFHFEGKPDDRVLRQLDEYANRYKVEIVIDTKPL